MIIGFYIFMFILGACFGSFLCCQARRLRLKEEGKKPLGKRSVCMSCKHRLAWYENIPLFSWLIQRGKCRKCKAKIGWAEFLAELGVATAFLLFATSFCPCIATGLEWGIFAATLVLILLLCFLAVYDGLYGELPSLCLTLSIICAIIIAYLHLWEFFSIPDTIYSALILGGLYLVLYAISRGKWVGNGDWLLGLAIGLALGKPWLALIVLFLSNTLACIIMFPTAKRKKDHKIYFGPFLVIAYIITVSFSSFLESMVI